MSPREAARIFGINRRTVEKMLKFSIPPGCRRDKEIRRPNLDAYTGIIDQILVAGKLVPKKQWHTSKRIFERLRDEHGFMDGITIVKDYILAARQRQREVFVPLAHPPGHAQADFGEALAAIGGIERKIHFLVMDLPHSDACFLKAYPAETTEAFCDAHVAAFAFFGGVPISIVYDNTRIAVARILGDGTRKRTRVFSELVSHYLFEDRFGRPGKGNDKGKVEGMVGYTRRNFMVPKPHFASFDDLNAHLAEQPKIIRVDNGPEYVGAKLMTWAEKQDIHIQYIQPGNPQQNAYIERYNRTVRGEWLGQNIFETIEEAQEQATEWLWTYNNDRPNMGIGGITPAMKLKMAA